MSKQSMPRARVVLLICMTTLLAACSHTDPDARTLQPPGGSAGATGSGGTGNSTASGNSDSSDQGNSMNTDQSSDAQNRDSDADDSNDSTGSSPDPKVPYGTLSYTIVFTGHSEVDTSEKHNTYDVSRRIQVTGRLRGFAGNVTKAPKDTVMGKVQACGDDAACQQAAVMAAMANPTAMDQDRHRMKGWFGQDRIWQQLDGACDGSANVDDKGDNHWKGWDTELNGRTSTQGKTTFDCSQRQTEINFNDMALKASMDTHTYTLTLPRFEMDARYVFGDQAPTTRSVTLPGLVIKNVKFTTLDAPLHGSVTLHNGDDGNVLDDPGGSLTAKVDWTFTPDAK